MPVTVVVAPHITATTVKGPHQQQRRRPLERSSSPAFDILRAGCPGALGNSKDAKLIQSSVDETQIPCILPLSNGFVDTCLLAYNQHHHLVIRPDDVWCAILAQFNLYVNGHAEEMREWFVAHEGKKELEIVTEGSSQLVDWGWLSETMGRLIKENVTDPDLHSWIIPSFTTTTTTDTTVASIIMMSTLKSYFSYKFSLRCGIPSVTLQGELSDWQDIVNRVSKLSIFNSKGQHPELTSWQTLLEPVLQGFVQTFEHYDHNSRHPEGQKEIAAEASIVEFWSKICHKRSFGSGPRYLSGWITAFCVFNGEALQIGKWQGSCVQRGHAPYEFLTLGSVMYPLVDMNDVPPGWAEVNVRVDDNGREYAGKMIAGNVGARAVMENEGRQDELGDTIGPYQAWFMLEMPKEDAADQTVYPKGGVLAVPPFRPGR